VLRPIGRNGTKLFGSGVSMQKTSSEGFWFCSCGTAKAVQKKQMHFLVGPGAWPSALSRARSARSRKRSERPRQEKRAVQAQSFRRKGIKGKTGTGKGEKASQRKISSARRNREGDEERSRFAEFLYWQKKRHCRAYLREARNTSLREPGWRRRRWIAARRVAAPRISLFECTLQNG